MGEEKVFQSMLIEFMEEKQKIITTELGEEFDTSYFNDKDKQIIETWSEKDCKDVWDRIVESIIECEESGLTTPTCPFCIYPDLQPDYSDSTYECKTECEYSKNHGVCCANQSDFRIICAEFNRMGNVNHHPEFPNSTYVEIIKKITTKKGEKSWKSQQQM